VNKKARSAAAGQSGRNPDALQIAVSDMFARGWSRDPNKSDKTILFNVCR
jgi:hypothetical protein